MGRRHDGYLSGENELNLGFFRGWALGSAVEHRLHTAGVSGSNPLAPTNLPPWTLCRSSGWQANLSSSMRHLSELRLGKANLRLSVGTLSELRLATQDFAGSNVSLFRLAGILADGTHAFGECGQEGVPPAKGTERRGTSG